MKEVINMPSCPVGTFPYRIKQGDTLWELADRYATTVNAISEVNPGLNLNSLYIGQIICIPSTPTHMNPDQNMSSDSDRYSQKEVDLMNEIRKLWEQHGTWTRMTIISMAENLKDVDLVTNRLLRNPKDFANLLRPLYGNDAASRFENLLTNHLTIAADLVEATKSGNTRAAADAEKKWYENADEIAAFLASINPYWNESEWRNMLREHLSLVTAEAVNRLNGNYAADIRVYDQIEDQALKMADVMSMGIIRQFPNQF